MSNETKASTMVFPANHGDSGPKKSCSDNCGPATGVNIGIAGSMVLMVYFSAHGPEIEEL